MRYLLLLAILLVGVPANAQVKCNGHCDVALTRELGIQLYLALTCPDKDTALNRMRKKIRDYLIPARRAPKVRPHRRIGINDDKSPDIDFQVVITLNKDDFAYWRGQLFSRGPIEPDKQKQLEKELDIALSRYGPGPTCCQCSRQSDE